MRKHAADAELPRHEDERVQRAVLAILLDAYPAQRSIDEVVRELADRPASLPTATPSTTRSGTSRAPA